MDIKKRLKDLNKEYELTYNMPRKKKKKARKLIAFKMNVVCFELTAWVIEKAAETLRKIAMPTPPFVNGGKCALQEGLEEPIILQKHKL